MVKQVNIEKPQALSSAKQVSTLIVGEDVRLDSLLVHVAHAESPRAGVLLYPTIFGLNDAMRQFAEQFAAAGFTAVVWDPYNGEEVSGEFHDMASKSREVEDHSAVGDLKAIVDYMQGELGLAFIAAAGWCFGARIALVHAGVDHRVGAVCTYNPTILPLEPMTVGGFTTSRADFPGQTMDEYEMAAAVRGPVQVSRPARDFTQSAEYDRLMEVLYSREDPTFYEYYPNAEHGFSYTPGEANERAHRFSWDASLSILNEAVSAVSR